MIETATRDQLKHLLSNRNNLQALYFPDLGELKLAIDCLKNLGVVISMTAGVYDMFHDGHAEYLRKARLLGDILVLAVDTDQLVVSRKGPGRPFAKLEERLRVLADQRCVDILTLCDVNPDPSYVVKAVHPDVLIASKTTKEMTPEVIEELGGYCGRVELLAPQSSNSTTARLRQVMVDGALDQLVGVHDYLGQIINALRAERDGLPQTAVAVGGDEHGEK